MKIIRKVLKITSITLLVLLVLAFLIPVLFKKQITALVKKEINKSIEATVEFSDVKLSLFRHFPRVGIVINDLSIVGKGEFAADTLISARKVDGAAGLFSVLKGDNIKVTGLHFESPRIHALVNEDGKANWDIAKASSDTASTDTSASSFHMTLKKYSIHDGYLLFRDKQAKTLIELNDLDHSGSGDLTAEVFTLSTKTKAGSAHFVQDGIPYLAGTKTDITADIQIDNRDMKYTFKTDDIILNDLTLSADGFVQLVNDSTFNMDVKFASPSNDFKSILSMIPDIYRQDFDKIKTSGKAVFNGFVKGTYTPQQMPAYDVHLAVENGFFQYPDLPKPVKNINLDLVASNVDGQPDNAVINISKGHLEMDNEPFDFRFIYKNPETIQFIDAAAKGRVDLSQVSQFIKLPEGTKLSGNVMADAFVQGPMKAIQQQTGSFTAGGFFDVRDLFYSDKSFPQPIKNGRMKATLENAGGVADNTTVNIREGHVEVGADPVDFNVTISKPVSDIAFNGHANGRFTLDNIKQFTTLEPGTSIGGTLQANMGFTGSKADIDKEQYDRILLDGTANVSKLSYTSPAYPGGVAVSNAQVTFNQKKVTLNSLVGKYLNTNFSASGVLDNLVGFAMSDQALAGQLNVNADKVNLNDWMGTSASPSSEAPTTAATTSSSSDPFIVPANVNFVINAKVDNVKYDGVDYNNVNGTLELKDEAVLLKDVRTNALDGSAVINGSYSTRLDKKEPDIGLSYDIKDMSVQKVFNAFMTVKALMPIGKFLDGKLNSQLSLTGNLNGNMMPDLNSLSGKGNLLLLQGVLKKFAPLEKLATVLQIDRLKSISVKDIKNYIEFANGKVLVKPFTLKIDDIEMEIGGFHGFDQSIDYGVQMKLPRSVMGSKGNELVNGLFAKAASKGIPVKPSETVNLHVKLTGSMNDPNIGIDLKEMAGDVIEDIKEQAEDFVKAKLDSAKQKAKDSLAAVKEKVEEKLKDKLKEKIFGKDTTQAPPPADTTKKKEGSGIKGKIKDIFTKPKKDTTKGK